MTRGVPALWSRLRATIEMDTNGIVANEEKRISLNTDHSFFCDLKYSDTVRINIVTAQC